MRHWALACPLFLSEARAGVAEVGDYVSVNQMKKSDSEAWSKLETEVWKPIQEARIKDGQMSAWGSCQLVLAKPPPRLGVWCRVNSSR